jgi:HTH-type transcriptional regulator/antitoxin HigA
MAKLMLTNNIKQGVTEIKPIKTAKDYDKAPERLKFIFDAVPYSKEGDEAEISFLLIENFENKQYPIEPPDPIETIKIKMEDMNLIQKDLVGVIGEKSRVSKILNKKKKLTVEMIRELEQIIHISASVLINNYQLSK